MIKIYKLRKARIKKLRLEAKNKKEKIEIERTKSNYSIFDKISQMLFKSKD